MASAASRRVPSHDIPKTIYHEISVSMKFTTHLDHVSHCKTASGTNWSERWTYRVWCEVDQILFPGYRQVHPDQHHDTDSGSMKVAAYLNQISHCKTASGTNWSERWTYRVWSESLTSIRLASLATGKRPFLGI